MLDEYLGKHPRFDENLPLAYRGGPVSEADDPTPFQEYDQATRSGVNPVAWTAFFLCRYFFGIALMSVMGVILVSWLPWDVTSYAWYGGALLAAVGIPLGFVNYSIGRRLGPSEQVVSDRPGTPLGPLVSMPVGAFIGAVLAGLLAFFVLMMWASIVLCPLAPPTWRQSLLQTILYATAWIVGGGAVLGFIFGPFLGIKSYPRASAAESGAPADAGE